ncbi:MAG: helix-turn-helix domain-containing protein, partial [Clostridia bacterium]|nr:helix-turn-helix domain-containing protein [Clostridia bacterium]
MPVFRVEKTRDYTVMANHHLKNKELTLKAKGLLSVMLSLPEDWDYTLKGLSHINREGVDAIREAVRELERAGYVVRSRNKNAKGQFADIEYVIYEQPRRPYADEEPASEKPMLENPILDNPTQEKPVQGNPALEKPALEN